MKDVSMKGVRDARTLSGSSGEEVRIITNTGCKYIKTCAYHFHHSLAEDYHNCIDYIQFNNGYVFALLSLEITGSQQM